MSPGLDPGRLVEGVSTEARLLTPTGRATRGPPPPQSGGGDSHLLRASADTNGVKPTSGAATSVAK